MMKRMGTSYSDAAASPRHIRPNVQPGAHSGSFAKHPKGSQARIRLSSVFGRYAQDDEFGSRSINPMELYHNQVTRAQGSFSLRMFHRSWGIMMVQSNISEPCAVLDFPTRNYFARQLKTNHYDVVGISGITGC